jgi:hypothetical protein
VDGVQLERDSMKRIAALVLLCGPSLLWADTIHLQSGGTLEGVILKKDQDGVVVRLKYATVTVGSFDIASVEASAAAPVAGARLATWERCFQSLAARPWGADLRQIPARLIQSGPLQNVPYVVHTSGNYQVALYGDPDRPAAIEVGVSGAQRALEPTRKECVDLLASFLVRGEDIESLRSLPLESGKKESDGLVFETTEEPDSRGRETWWIAVSDPAALDRSRVSEKDVASLVGAEAPQTPSSPTLVMPGGTPGKGEKQDVITPFGTEPHDPPKPRRTYGGGGYWGGMLRWNHGQVTMPKPATTPPKK